VGISTEAQPKQPTRGGYIPAHVKREVWKRDAGRCQWPLSSGGVCGSTLRLEFDHVVPRALGGPSTTDGIRMLCRTHNDLAARLAFGDDWMDQFTRGNAARPPGEQAPRAVAGFAPGNGTSPPGEQIALASYPG